MRVAVVRCGSYDRKEVEGAVYRVLSYLEPIDVTPPLLVKPNLISPVGPKKAATTHPEVVRAVVRYFKEKTDDLIVGDNPGFIFDDQQDELFSKTGMEEVAAEEGVRCVLLRSEGFESVRIDSSELKEIALSKLVRRINTVINVPKMKTHVDTLLTGAVKNIFGTVASGTRRKAHMLGSNKKLAHAIVDIYRTVKPSLSLMDAVVGMEGNGPSHGSPKKAGYIIASKDGVAVDVVASYIMGFKPAEIDTIRYAESISAGVGDMEEIELVGDDVSVVPFERPAGWKLRMSGVIGAVGYRLVKLFPESDNSRCIKCGVCKEACPAEAIRLFPYPEVDRNRCIYCFTCNEVCPTGAMEIKKNFFARVLGY